MSLQAAIVPMGLASVMQRVLILGATGVACTEAADDGKEPIQFVQAQDARTAACVDDMSWRDSNHPADGCVSWTGYNCSESFDPWPGPNDYYDPPAVVLEKCPKTCKVCQTRTPSIGILLFGSTQARTHACTHAHTHARTHTIIL